MLLQSQFKNHFTIVAVRRFDITTGINVKQLTAFVPFFVFVLLAFFKKAAFIVDVAFALRSIDAIASAA